MKINLTGHVACVARRKASRILGEFEGKTQLRKPNPTREDNIKNDL